MCTIGNRKVAKVANNTDEEQDARFRLALPVKADTKEDIHFMRIMKAKITTIVIEEKRMTLVKLPSHWNANYALPGAFEEEDVEGAVVNNVMYLINSRRFLQPQRAYHGA